jgi:hypothetical protein
LPAPVAKSAVSVLVNGENAAFAAYIIGGHNYFKLRDVAYVLGSQQLDFFAAGSPVERVIAGDCGDPFADVKRSGSAQTRRSATPRTVTVQLTHGIRGNLSAASRPNAGAARQVVCVQALLGENFLVGRMAPVSEPTFPIMFLLALDCCS